MGVDLCCLFWNSELPVVDANRQLPGIREDKGICSADHLTTMDGGNAWMAGAFPGRATDGTAAPTGRYLRRVGGAGPLSGIDITLKQLDCFMGLR
ncbi:hypothetical protein UN63_05810 [Oceanisphaera arctica]|uniref:Uncharacterized protein n=1 Tax=Oceanisphaera arctica TaxID=641510 RepID=A0A2P5TNW8_9GAMM|nr:hypothetical protein UN63_05810 [Oceanisphaera arctica]